MNWYTRVTENLALLPDFIQYYESALEQHKQDIKISGSLERAMSMLPGQTEDVFNKLQVIEAVLKYMETQLRKQRSQVFKRFLEGYNRALSSRDAEKYVDGDSDVIDMELLINEVSLLRNRYLGIMKGIESKNYMLGHVTRLRVAGMEDARL